jgi:HEAT repeat protein
MLFFLLFSTAAICQQHGFTAKPKESAPQTEKPAQAEVPPPKAESKDPIADAIALTHTVIATSEAQIHAVEAIATIMAIILGLVGVTNYLDDRRNNAKTTRLEEDVRNLKEDISAIKTELGSLVQNVGNILEDVGKLREQDISLWRLAETAQAASLAASRLGADTRLKALQKLSQLADPLGIAPLLEVLTDNKSEIKLRREAAYGLGRYGDKSAFREYYPEIFSGFSEVLKNPRTPRELALETIKSARLFGTDTDELAHLFERWERRNAQTYPAGD